MLKYVYEKFMFNQFYCTYENKVEMIHRNNPTSRYKIRKEFNSR